MLVDRVVNLQEDHVDVAVRIGALPDSSLVATRVGSIGRVVCASPAYLAERGTPKTPGDLAGHDCITFGGLTSPDAWMFGHDKSTMTVAVHSRLVVNTAEAAIDAAVAGLGITRVLSYQAENAIRAGALVRLLRAFEPIAAPVSLVHAGQGLVPLKLRAFLDFAAPRLKARLLQSITPQRSKARASQDRPRSPPCPRRSASPPPPSSARPGCRCGCRSACRGAGAPHRSAAARRWPAPRPDLSAPRHDRWRTEWSCRRRRWRPVLRLWRCCRTAHSR